MSYLGNVGLSNKTDGLYLGLVNLSLNTSANQLLYSPLGYDISGLNLSDGLSKSGSNLKTVGNPDIQLTSHSLYANESLVSIQSQIDKASQADVIYVSAGSYSENISIDSKTNIALIGPSVGNTICETDGLQIIGDSTLIRVCNIQVQGSSNTISGLGRYYFKNVTFQGVSVGNQNYITINDFDAGKYATFENCEFDQYCTMIVPITFQGVIFFINCNFGGATISLGQYSNQQIILNNCAGYSSFPSNATLIGMNVLTNGVSLNTTTTTNTQFFLIGGDSTSSSVNQVITTNGVAGLKLTAIGGPSSFYNVFYETKNYTEAVSGSTINLYSVSNQANIIPSLRTVINFNANFSFTIAPQVAIFRLVNTDTDTEIQSFRQTLTGTTHQHIPLQFNFNMPNVYTLSYKIEITTVGGISVISVDDNDFYSIIINEIQAA
jgi:hypothetical protein